jgi:hypothetical protein
MNAAMKKAARKVSAVAALTVVAAGHAMAQTADPGVTAINDLSTKATDYISAAFAVAVLVAGGFWGIRMMKKAFGAAK